MLKKEEKIERLKWMLDAVESGALSLGLCSLYRIRYEGHLTDDMPEIVPSGKGNDDYWFPKGEKEPRIKLLREWIDKLSGEKSLVQQLVDNVNQNGGEIFGLRVGDKLPEDTINAWSREENNYSGDGLTQKSGPGGFFLGEDREIKSFIVVGGEIFFEVSDTINVYLRAEGYKKFAEEFKTPEQTYSIGQVFQEAKHGRHILSQVDPNIVCLIGLPDSSSLTTGNRWNDPIEVGDKRKITEKELKSIKGMGDFTLIDKK